MIRELILLNMGRLSVKVTPKESVELQKIAFKEGFKWRNSRSRIVNYSKIKRLVFYADKTICWKDLGYYDIDAREILPGTLKENNGWFL